MLTVPLYHFCLPFWKQIIKFHVDGCDILTTEQMVTLNHSSYINIEESLMTLHFGKQSAQDRCVMEFSKAEKLPM